MTDYMKHGADKQRGGCVRFDLENGLPVTILRVGGNEETLRFHVAKATTCPREVRPDEALGQRWPGFGLEFEGNIDDFIQNTVGHHYTLCFGDWTQELKYMADIYGMGNWVVLNNQLIWTAMHEMANNGTLEFYTSGQGDFTQCVELRDCLLCMKDAYDKGYWYPGEGALVSTKDQTTAAWYQGKIATLVDAGSNAGTYVNECPFEVGVMRLPVVREGGTYAFATITNALFIPANAKHPEEAVRFMKYYTSDAGITEIIKSGRLPATVSMMDKVETPIMQELLNTTVGDDVVGYKLIQYISSEIYSFIEDDIVGAVCSGIPVDEVLQQLEDMRLAAVGN